MCYSKNFGTYTLSTYAKRKISNTIINEDIDIALTKFTHFGLLF